MAGHHGAAQDVDDLDEEQQKGVARLLDVEQDGLDVVLEEDARDGPVRDLAVLLRDGVLVGEDGGAEAAGRRPDAVDGRDDRQEVLELVEVRVCAVDGAVERVDERGVELAKRELVDDVGEVEGCSWSVSLRR